MKKVSLFLVMFLVTVSLFAQEMPTLETVARQLNGRLNTLTEKASVKYEKSGNGVKISYLLKDASGKDVVVQQSVKNYQDIYGNLALVNQQLADLDNADKQAKRIASEKEKLTKIKGQLEEMKAALESGE